MGAGRPVIVTSCHGVHSGGFQCTLDNTAPHTWARRGTKCIIGEPVPALPRYLPCKLPAQLVWLAAACEQWWRLGWCRPGSGPADVLGEGLAGWLGKGLAVARCRPRQGPCRGSGGLPRQASCRGLSSSNPHLILSVPCLHKDLHANMEVPPKP